MSTVFFDVDTQLDFVYPAGALYVPGAERVLPAVEKLNRYAAGHGLPVISTTDAHAENDPEFRVWPPHCVRGTFGQRKAPGTLLENRLVVAPERGDYSAGGGIRQIILQKQTLDCFSNPNLTGLLDQLDAERCVVYGVVTEYCVRQAVLGLLRTGRRVELVRDAVQSLKEEDERRTLEEITAAGGRVTSVAEVCA